MSIGQKGNISVILLVVILILIISGGAYYLGTQNSNTTQISNITSITPTSNPNNELSDWEVYNNLKYGYQIKYPSNLNRNIYPNKVDLLLNSVSFVDKDNKASQPSEVSIAVYESNNLSLSDWLNTHATTEPFGSSSDKVIYGYSSAESISINDLPAIRFNQDIMGKRGDSIALKNEQYIYIINNTVSGGDSLIEIYEKMIPTFRIID